MRWLVRQRSPAFVWAAVIWLFSTHWFCYENTSRIFLPILEWLFPGASFETLNLVHRAIRKSAHFAEYFILSLLLLFAIRGDRRGWRPAWAKAAVTVTAGYAALDEFHQLFVPGRRASVWDVLLDLSGAVAAQLVAGWIATRRGRFRKGETEEGQNAPRPIHRPSESQREIRRTWLQPK